MKPSGPATTPAQGPPGLLTRLRGGLGLLRSLVIYWRPGRQRGLQALYAPFVEPGDVVFDVGAHLGDRTAAFSALGARVLALEPQPLPARWLARLVGGRPGVEIRRAAVGPEVGVARLAVSPAHPTVSTLADDFRERIPGANPTFSGVRWESSVEVPVTTLDALIREFGVPAFCKVDVEGYEAHVLAGLTTAIPALSVEFVAGGLDVARACVRRLEALGDYRFNVIPGEERRFLLPGWVSSGEILAWLDQDARTVSSGDLYARLAPPAPPS